MGRRARRQEKQQVQQLKFCETCGCDMPVDHRDAVASAQAAVAGVEVR